MKKIVFRESGLWSLFPKTGVLIDWQSLFWTHAMILRETARKNIGWEKTP